MTTVPSYSPIPPSDRPGDRPGGPAGASKADRRSGSTGLSTGGPTDSVGRLADAVAAAALACPGVVALTGGQYGEVATYLPGRRVRGVRIRPDAVTVHVAVRFGTPVAEVADAVRARVREVTDVPTVDVGIDDVIAPTVSTDPTDPAESP